MPLIFETPNYAASRDRIGHWLLQHKQTAKSVYLQGDDATQFETELAHVPARMLDSALSDFDVAMT